MRSYRTLLRGPALVVTEEAAEPLAADDIVNVDAMRIRRRFEMVGWSVAEPLVRPFFVEMSDR